MQQKIRNSFTLQRTFEQRISSLKVKISPTFQRTFFGVCPPIRENFYKKCALGFLRTRAQYICGYEILENSKHSRCPYTRRFSIKETLPLIYKMLVGMPPKPSIFTKGRLPMANRTRPNQILFFVSDDEKRMIQAKMARSTSMWAL